MVGGESDPAVKIRAFRLVEWLNVKGEFLWEMKINSVYLNSYEQSAELLASTVSTGEINLWRSIRVLVEFLRYT